MKTGLKHGRHQKLYSLISLLSEKHTEAVLIGSRFQNGQFTELKVTSAKN